MNTSEQHKATPGSCLLDLFLRPLVGLLELLTVGERGEVKNRESQEQPRLVPAKEQEGILYAHASIWAVEVPQRHFL